jgi:hypothetical protein
MGTLAEAVEALEARRSRVQPEEGMPLLWSGCRFEVLM